MNPLRNYKNQILRILASRNFLITLVLAIGLAPIYLLPDFFFPLDDCTEQLYPFLMETKRMLSTDAPWWTWSSFLGDSFIGSYAYYTITRPLLLAVCLLPYKHIGVGLAVAVYLNFLILGWLSSCYLRIMGFGRRLRLIGSLLFTLSSYMICQLCYCMFLEPVEAFVILLFCIERFLRSQRMSAATLTLASFAVVFVNYYFMPGTFIIGTLYFLCRAVSCCRGRWLRLTLKAAGCVGLGIAMASVVLLPVTVYLSHPTRPSTGLLDYIFVGYNWILRALSLVAPTPQEGFLFLNGIESGWLMNMAYVTVFGLLPFILFAARHRRSWLTILCLIFIFCLLTPLNALFSLFTHPLYSRWTYALIMMLIVASLCYLKHRSGQLIPRRPVLIYCAVTSAFVLVIYCDAAYARFKEGLSVFDKFGMTYFAALFLFALNTGALLLLTRWPVLSKRWTRTCISSILVIAIAQFLYLSFHYAHKSAKRTDIYEMTARLTAERADCDTFTARTYFEPHPDRPHQNRNLHLFSNRQAITTFVSTLNPFTTGLVPMIDTTFTWDVHLCRNREAAVTLLSVKDYTAFGDYPFEKIPQAAVQGDRYIPMGMAYDRYSLISDSISDMDYVLRHDIMRGMLASLVIREADEPELSRYLAPVEFCDTLPFDTLVAARRAFTCDSFKGDSHGFTATISLPDTMVVMFSAAADPGFSATIDGKPSKIYNVNMGMSASIVPAGRHTIRYEYFPPGLRGGAWLSLAAFAIFLILAICEYRAPRL